jgi:hypothetical protein
VEIVRGQCSLGGALMSDEAEEACFVLRLQEAVAHFPRRNTINGYIDG